MERKPKWVAWVPTTVLALAIAALLTTTAVLVGGGLGEPAPRATAGQVTELNWSIFTAKGLAYIESTRRVRVDFSRGPVDASALGLAADDSITIGPRDSGDVALDYYLTVNGGGEAPGGDRLTVGQLTLDTRGGVLTSIRAPLREVPRFRTAVADLLAEADTYGWDVSALDAIYSGYADSISRGEGFSFSFGPGDRLGFAIAAHVQCDTTGYCLVTYEISSTSEGGPAPG